MKNIKFFKNKDTNKYIEFNELSRKHHTIVMGLTGSGKSSQIILPMMNEDVKNNESIILLEPKEVLSEKLYAMAKHYNKEHIYIDFSSQNMKYYYNIFDEEIETLIPLFSNIFEDMYKKEVDDYHLSLNLNFLLTGLKLIKEHIVNPDLKDLHQLFNDKKFLKVLMYLNKEENQNDFQLFIDYHEKESVLYKEMKLVRKLIRNLVENKFLQQFLIPSKEKEKLDFYKIVNSNIIFAINTSKGVLRELSSFIEKLFSYKILDTLYEKPANSDIINYFYMDEPQLYMNKYFDTNILTKKGVAITFSMQTLLVFEEEYRNILKTNIANVILCPSLNRLDAEYFSKIMNASPEGVIYRPFGEVTYSFRTKKGIENGIASIVYLEKELNNELNSIVEYLYVESKNK